MRLRKNKSLMDRAIDQASDVVDAALPVIESAVATAREQLKELSKDAAENAKDLANDTREKAGPLLAETRALAAEIAEATKEVAIPKAKERAGQLAVQAVDLTSSGLDKASTKVAELKGEPQKQKKSHKFRNLLVFGSLTALGGFLYQKMRGNKEADNWQSSYTPPASTTAATTGAHAADAPADDPAGASPDEALADATEEPHAVTTPDAPAEVVDLESDEANKS